MLLKLIFDKKIKRGNFTVCANILLCVTLLTRAVTFGTALYALILLLSDNVIHTVHYSLVNEIKIFGTIPMGQLLKGVVYSSLAILMPLQLSSGLLGFLGYMCKHKGAIIIHFILLCLSMSLLVVYFVLIGGVLHEFYSNIEANFVNEILYGTGREEVQSKLGCCGLTGNANSCLGSTNTNGCWDIWSERMHTFCSTLMSLYTLSFCLEVINIIVTDYRYRELRKDDYHPFQYRTSFLTKLLPRDIIGHSCFSIITFVKREGLLEFFCRVMFIAIAGLGMSMLAYGAASFVEYPKLSHPSINFLTVTNTGLNLYSVVRIISGLLFSVGSLMLIGAVFSTVSSCFRSITALFAQAIILCVGILVKAVFLCSWIPLYMKTRSSIDDSLRELYIGQSYNDAWLNFVKAYDCCGIWVNSDTIDDHRSGEHLCRYSYQYENKQTCSSVFEENLDTFAKATITLLGVSLFIEILLLLYIEFKVRRISKTVSSTDTNVEIKVKGLFAYFRDFLQKLIKQTPLNWIPILLIILIVTTAVTFTTLGLCLCYDRVFTYVHISYLFSNIYLGGVYFSDILRELAGTYFSLAAFEVLLYVMLIVTYSYKSKFLAIFSVILQAFAAATTVAFICRWIFVANNVAIKMGDALNSSLQNYYSMADDSAVSHDGYLAMTTPSFYSWNSLMLRLQCCGATSKSDFSNTGWSTKISSSAKVPSYCCNTMPSSRYIFGYASACQESVSDDNTLIFSESCNTKILDRFERYYAAMFVIGILNIGMHITLIVLLVLRYRRLQSTGKIDKTMNELWTTIKQNWLRLSFQLTSVICGVLGISLLVYGAVNIKTYPTFDIREVMSQMNIVDMRFDDVILALCIGVIIIGSFNLLSSSFAFFIPLKTAKEAFFVYVFITSMNIFLEVVLMITWIVMSTQLKSHLVSMLQHFYHGKAYLTWWNAILSGLGCCGIREAEDTGDCTGTKTCTSVIESHFTTFTTAVMTMLSFLLVAQVVSLIIANIHIRRLSYSSEKGAAEGLETAKGIASHIKDKFIQIKTENRINLVSLSLFGVLFVFGFAFVMFGLDAMHDGYFTEINVKLLLDRLTFNGRSFSVTMKYYGVGFICVGIFEMCLTFTGVISLIYTSRVLTTIVIVMRGYFILCLFTMLGFWIDIHVEVAWNLYNQMIADLRLYYISYGAYTNSINYWQMLTTDAGTLSWNSVFTKFSCCGVSDYKDFTLSPWYNARPNSGIHIPVYCCETTDRYKYGYDYSCQFNLISHYTTGCSYAVQKRFNMYSIALYLLIAFVILIQLVQMVLLVIRLVRMFKRNISGPCDSKCSECCSFLFGKRFFKDDFLESRELENITKKSETMTYDRQKSEEQMTATNTDTQADTDKKKLVKKKGKKRKPSRKVVPTQDDDKSTTNTKENVDEQEDLASSLRQNKKDPKDKVVESTSTKLPDIASKVSTEELNIDNDDFDKYHGTIQRKDSQESARVEIKNDDIPADEAKQITEILDDEFKGDNL